VLYSKKIAFTVQQHKTEPKVERVFGYWFELLVIGAQKEESCSKHVDYTKDNLNRMTICCTLQDLQQQKQKKDVLYHIINTY
jgi:hypothetical protein